MRRTRRAKDACACGGGVGPEAGGTGEGEGHRAITESKYKSPFDRKDLYDVPTCTRRSHLFQRSNCPLAAPVILPLVSACRCRTCRVRRQRGRRSFIRLSTAMTAPPDAPPIRSRQSAPSLCRPSAFASIVGALSIRGRRPRTLLVRGSPPLVLVLAGAARSHPDATPNQFRAPFRSLTSLHAQDSVSCSTRLREVLAYHPSDCPRWVETPPGPSSGRGSAPACGAAPSVRLSVCACVARASVRLSVLALPTSLPRARVRCLAFPPSHPHHVFLSFPPSLPPGEDGPRTSTPVLPPPPSLALSPSVPDCRASLPPARICLASLPPARSTNTMSSFPSLPRSRPPSLAHSLPCVGSRHGR